MHFLTFAGKVREGARDERGLTLVELLVVMVIMAAVGTMVMSATLNVVRLVMLNSEQNIAETSGRNFLTRMMEDIRSAGEKTAGGSAGAIWDGSDDKRIYITKYGHNLDAHALPATGDMLDDVVCYGYTPPNPPNGWDNPAYVPGSITNGITSGDQKCAAADMAPITDRLTDVQEFKISYCRPAPGVPGTYACGSVVQEPGAAFVNDSSCVFKVRVEAKIRKLFNKQKMGQGPTVSFSASAKPRNIYMKAMATDDNDNGIIDCCDAAYVGNDVDWCPSPTTH